MWILNHVNLISIQKHFHYIIFSQMLNEKNWQNNFKAHKTSSISRVPVHPSYPRAFLVLKLKIVHVPENRSFSGKLRQTAILGTKKEKEKHWEQRLGHHLTIQMGRSGILRDTSPRGTTERRHCPYLWKTTTCQFSSDYPKCNNTGKLRLNTSQAVLVYMAFWYVQQIVKAPDSKRSNRKWKEKNR